MLPIQRFANKNSDSTISVKRSSEFRRYHKKVFEMTELTKNLIPGIELRGFKTYHIDHIVSIYEGYVKGIPVEDIASLSNLRMLPAIENLKKGRKFRQNETK